MDSCNKWRSKIALFLDNRLAGEARAEFEDHLRSCEGCRSELEQEQQLSGFLRASGRLYVASEELRRRVEPLLRDAPALKGSDGIRQRVAQTAFRYWQFAVAQPVRKKALAAGLVAAGLCLAFLAPIQRQVSAETFVNAAVDVHRGYKHGDVPLELRSHTPAAVTSWIAARVPFHFRLPEMESSPEQPAAYQLTGASILNSKKGKVALVVYEMQTRTISLVVAPSDSAIISGGEEVHFGKLTFHYHSIGNLQAITWSNHGLAYALVSPQSGPAQQSCLVCHQSMANLGKFQQQSHASLPHGWKMGR